MSEFYVLKRRTEKPEKKPKKKKPPKFKKGSWKHWLYKKLNRWISSRHVEDFHFVRLENVLISTGKSPEVVIFKKRLDKRTLKRLEDGYILINATDRMYMRIPISAYKKLMKVDKIAISHRLRGYYDGEADVMDIYEYDVIIDNINELARFINYHRQAISGVYEVQAACCGYTDFQFQFKILVTMTDGSVKTYKSDMNDFLKDYDLYQF